MNNKNKKKMGIVDFAKEQFDLLEKNSPDIIILKYKKEILDICKKMADEGHSGASADMYRRVLVDALDRFLQIKPINPIYNTEDEWVDINGGKLFQNKFCRSLFKDNEGNVYNNELLIKHVKYQMIHGKKIPCKKGCWHGGVYLTREDALNDTNRVVAYIKKFPYSVPTKPVYLDVIEEEIDKDSWIMWMNNPKQLEELDPEIYEIAHINSKNIKCL